jgi:hypothetical protein
MDEVSIKFQLQNLANKIGFEFQNNWFNVIWIEKKEEIFIEFLSDCQYPIYKKYGSTLGERISNLDKFLNSIDFEECCKRYGGSPSSKQEFFDLKKIIESLEESNIKNDLLKFTDRVISDFGENDFSALLTKTNIKEEYEDLLNSILRHEWIHELLYKNNLKFSDIKEEYWIYDEGFCTYFEYFLDNNLSILEKKRDNEKYPYEKQYFINAIKFKEMLQDVDISEYKKIIENFYNSLK